VDVIGLPEKGGDITENIIPKITNFLLPFNRLYRHRQKCEHLHLPRGLKSIIWRAYFDASRAIMSRREWPKTMEILCQATKSPVAINNKSDRDDPICIVLSMQGYGRICVQLTNALIEKGYPVALLAPKESDRWGTLRGLSNRCGKEALEDFFDKDIEKRFLTNCQYATTRWPKISKEISYDGPPVLKDLLRVAPGQLKYVVTEIIPQAYAYKALAQSALGMLRPRALFVVRLKRFTENAFADAAKELEIPVVLANHGHIGARWEPLSLGNVEKRCDAILSWNEMQRETWLTLFPKLDQKKIHTIGGIQWDEPIRRYQGNNGLRKREIREKIVTEFNANRHRKIGIDRQWLTITVDEHVKRVLKKIVKILDKLSGLHLFIKTRSHESEADYEHIVKMTPSFPMTIVSKDSDVDLFELLYASDLVMTCVSTTNLDALSVGTPVITLTMDRKSKAADRYVYLENYGLPVVTSKRELRLAILKWIADEACQIEWREASKNAARALLANYPRGDAGEKIAGVMNSLTEVCM
jgi:glycosyltransferase involved in cell wall biosynthesis